MKKILYFLAGMTLASCSEYEYDYSNLSDKNITFKVDDVTASVYNNVAGRAAVELREGWQHVVKAEACDGNPMYLQSYVQPTESQAYVEGIAKGSRAAITTANLTSFGLLAYRYESGNSATTPNFMYNEQVSKSGNVWSSTQQYNWPETDKVDFYAYAPYNGTGVTLSSQSATGTPVIDFTMNSSAASQIDLVTAVATGKDKSNASSGVSFTFGHALTTVKFVKGDDLLGTIESITLKNVYLSGKYTIGGSWNFTGKSTSDYEPAMNTSLMMIPQTFGSNASLEVVYNDGLTTHTLIYSLNGITWQAGETITYRVSSEEVSMLHLQNITFPIIHANFPKTAYANGDEAGLYVVDAGGTVKNSNVKLTYNGTAWSAASAMVFSPEYDYYVYYPYTSAGLANNGTAGAKMMSRATTHTAGDATSFFEPGIAAFAPQSNQSTVAGFLASDLQIAKGYVSVSDNISMQFEMVHAMGLAQFELGTKNIDQEYYLSTDANYRFVGSGGATATSSFATGGYQPYSYATGKYLVWVKPNTATTISSDAGETDTWETSLTFNVAANTISDKQTAYSARTTSGSSTQYTLQVGDYLYSDGSFAHSSSMPTATAARHPIAVVFSTTTSSTDNAAGYKSGYAIALASAGAQLTWCKAGIGAASASVNSAVTTLAAAKADLDGRTETNRIKTLSDFSKENYPSAYYATHFGTSEIGLTSGTESSSTEASGGSAGYAAPANTSGWYLGSIGQYYLVAKNLGSNIDNPSSTWTEGSSHNNWYVSGASQANKNALEAIFAKGSSSWAPSFGMPWSSNQYSTWYWTSSEFSASNGFNVYWNNNGSFHLDGHSAKSYPYTNNRGVRPVLAF